MVQLLDRVFRNGSIRQAAISEGMSYRTAWQMVRKVESIVGKPVVKGTRIAVELVIDLLARGYSKEQILEQYDHITVDDIQACLSYASEALRSERVYAIPG